MATYDGNLHYYGTASTTTSDGSNWTTNTTSYFEVDMSSEKSPAKKATKNKSKEKGEKLQSSLLTLMSDTVGFVNSRPVLCFYGPGNFGSTNPYIQDVNLLRGLGYGVGMDYCDSIEYLKSSVCAGIGAAFLVNVLECIPDMMERALILKNLIGKFSHDVTGIFIISTRTREDLEKEAKESKYTAQDKGYMVKDYNLKQPIYIEPIEKTDILDLLTFIGFDITTVKENNTENCIAMPIVQTYSRGPSEEYWRLEEAEEQPRRPRRLR